MTTRATLNSKGFAEYFEALVKLGRDVDQVAADMLQAGGQVLVDGMKQRVPKDTHNLEEHLVCTEPERDGNYTFVVVGMDPNTDAETARYGNAQEYGTSSMSAQPYIRPTLDSDMSTARKAMKQVLIEGGL